MFFDLENLFDKSGDYVKYSLDPYPPYFLSYDWVEAEKEADNNIMDEQYVECSSIESLKNNQEIAKILINNRSTKRFDKDFKNLPENAKLKLTQKIFPILLTNPKAKQINAKRVTGQDARWHIKIDFYYTFSFGIIDRCIFLRCVGPIVR